MSHHKFHRLLKGRLILLPRIYTFFMLCEGKDITGEEGFI